MESSFFFIGVLQPHQHHYCAILGPKEGSKRGDISQEWDILMGCDLQGEVLRNGVADSPLSVILHDQLFTYL